MAILKGRSGLFGIDEGGCASAIVLGQSWRFDVVARNVRERVRERAGDFCGGRG